MFYILLMLAAGYNDVVDNFSETFDQATKVSEIIGYFPSKQVIDTNLQFWEKHIDWLNSAESELKLGQEKHAHAFCFACAQYELWLNLDIAHRTDLHPRLRLSSLKRVTDLIGVNSVPAPNFKYFTYID